MPEPLSDCSAFNMVEAVEYAVVSPAPPLYVESALPLDKLRRLNLSSVLWFEPAEYGVIDTLLGCAATGAVDEGIPVVRDPCSDIAREYEFGTFPCIVVSDSDSDIER